MARRGSKSGFIRIAEPRSAESAPPNTQDRHGLQPDARLRKNEPGKLILALALSHKGGPKNVTAKTQRIPDQTAPESRDFPDF